MAQKLKTGPPPSLLMRLSAVFLTFGILSCSGARAVEQERPESKLFHVGYKVMDFKYQKDGREKILTTAVWYPTAAAPGPHNYGGPARGRVAIDTAPLAEDGPYPMLVFSHGYGGSGLGAVFFTERLAARGWIVAAPDHHDRHCAVRIREGHLADFNRAGLWRHAREIAASGPMDRGKYLYRLDEMRLVLDGMAASKTFCGVIDSRRIAVGGHSFGGYTALGLCGTIEERHDPRIRAVLLFSTGAGGYLFRAAELSAVRIPSMLFMGEREKDQFRGSKTMWEIADKIHGNLPPPKYFLEIRDASHFSFNNRFADNWKTKLLSGTEDQFEVIRQYAIAFLESHVAGKPEAGFVLDRSHRMLTHYARVPVGMK